MAIYLKPFRGNRNMKNRKILLAQFALVASGLCGSSVFAGSLEAVCTARVQASGFIQWKKPDAYNEKGKKIKQSELEKKEAVVTQAIANNNKLAIDRCKTELGLECQVVDESDRADPRAICRIDESNGYAYCGKKSVDVQASSVSTSLMNLIRNCGEKFKKYGRSSKIEEMRQVHDACQAAELEGRATAKKTCKAADGRYCNSDECKINIVFAMIDSYDFMPASGGSGNSGNDNAGNIEGK